MNSTPHAATPSIILALDTPDIDMALNWVRATDGLISVAKLGLEFFISCGVEGVRRIQGESGVDIFLDLKLHDIPNTVGQAAAAVSSLQPRFLTVHASGGSKMISAAVSNAPSVDITAVTVLTSLDKLDLSQIGFAQPPLESAVQLAALAKVAGARAIVCSPQETSAIRRVVGPEITIITPGVRPQNFGSDDQERVMTPRDAISAGANYLVVGRPITSHWKDGNTAMREAAIKFAAELG